DITPTGAYQTVIAIEAPLYHGIQPQLRIVYDSSAGSGVLGVGWRLAGLSEIRQVSQGKGAPILKQMAHLRKNRRHGSNTPWGLLGGRNIKIATKLRYCAHRTTVVKWPLEAQFCYFAHRDSYETRRRPDCRALAGIKSRLFHG